MSEAYTVSGNDAVGNPSTLICLASQLFRFKLYDWMIGSASTAPADVAILWTVARLTVNGTGGTAKVALPLDSGGGIAAVITNESPTSEPTYTSNQELMEVGVNERATFRWVAAPGGELVVNTTSSTGLGLHSTHASDTDQMWGTTKWFE